jgi:hypothetical protein
MLLQLVVCGKEKLWVSQVIRWEPPSLSSVAAERNGILNETTFCLHSDYKPRLTVKGNTSSRPSGTTAAMYVVQHVARDPQEIFYVSFYETLKQRRHKTSAALGQEKFRRLPIFKSTFLKACCICIQMELWAGRPGSITGRSKRPALGPIQPPI